MTPATPATPAGSDPPPPTTRALLAAAVLACVWLVLTWMPASVGEAWPARAGDLQHAVPAVAVVMAASLFAGVISRLHRVGAFVGGLVLAAALLGWPLLVRAIELPGAIAAQPLHTLAALLAAAAAIAHARRPALTHPRARWWGAGAVAAAFGLAFVVSERVGSDLPPMTGERVVLALLEEPDRWEVKRENKRRPVVAASFAAGDVTQFDAGTLPLLEMTPPAEVHIRIPPTSPDAVLRLGAGISADSYRSAERTRVHLEAVFEGESHLQAQVSTFEGIVAKRRVWRRAEIPVGGGGTLVLRTRFEGPAPERPRAGFALLEVVEQLEERRTLPSRRRPNAILVVIDTLRADRLSSYGNPREASPALDALAERGTLFETAFSTASWTWPSTASVLTSLTPPEHGVLDQSACYLAEGLVSVAEVFQASGVSTAAFSSNPLVSADKNFDKGFETFREYRWQPASRVLADVEEWLEEMGGVRFFLYVHLIDPHGPYEPDEDLAESFGLPAPRDYSVETHTELVTSLRRSEPTDMGRLARNAAYLSSLYDGEVATADRALEHFFERLEELGLADRTVVVVTSDHGEEFLEHGMMGHGRQIFEESVRVPLIFAGPGVSRGRRVELAVENRFVAPTLLELCDIAPLGNLAGRPDLLDAAELELRAEEPIFFASDLGWWPGAGARALRGVRLPGRMLILSPAVPAAGENGAAPELVRLFDLDRDPSATTDVSAERPEEVQRLRSLVEAWLERAEERRPAGFDGGAEVRDMLLDLGYIGD